MNKYITSSDLELLTLLQEGNEAAYTEIYGRYWSLLYRHSFKILKEEDRAMDVVQDVFTSLWFNRHAIPVNTALSAYLYVAVRNRTLTIINKNKLETRYLESLQSFIHKGKWVTDETVRFNELAEEIETEIAKLPPRMREIFDLRRKAGLSYKDIAIKLDISDESVKTQVARALKKLRSKFGCTFTLPFI